MQKSRVAAMKRAYADLHLCTNIGNMDQISRIVAKVSSLGYRLVAVAFPKLSDERIWQTRDMCKEAGLDFASRVDLRPRTPDDLLASLRKLRRKFEVVAVTCESKSVARQAAKDHRVDLLNFPKPDYRSAFFDPAEAELASSCSASFEIDMKPLLTQEGPTRTRLLSLLRREVAIAREYHVSIVISSGVSDGVLLRKPKDMAALASLFDLNGIHALDAVSKNPTVIVNRNRQKLRPQFVAPGIRIIRRGKDG